MTGWIITIALSLVFVALGIIMLTGRGANLIAGYNTLSAEEKKKYDRVALCKFIGKIVLIVGLITPSIAIGSKIAAVYSIIVFGLTVFTVIYANKGSHFKK